MKLEEFKKLVTAYPQVQWAKINDTHYELSNRCVQGWSGLLVNKLDDWLKMTEKEVVVLLRQLTIGPEDEPKLIKMLESLDEVLDPFVGSLILEVDEADDPVDQFLVNFAGLESDAALAALANAKEMQAIKKALTLYCVAVPETPCAEKVPATETEAGI